MQLKFPFLNFYDITDIIFKIIQNVSENCWFEQLWVCLMHIFKIPPLVFSEVRINFIALSVLVLAVFVAQSVGNDELYELEAIKVKQFFSFAYKLLNFDCF